MINEVIKATIRVVNWIFAELHVWIFKPIDIPMYKKVDLSSSQTRDQIWISQSTVLWNFLYNKTNPIVVIEGNILLSEKYLRLSVTQP